MTIRNNDYGARDTYWDNIGLSSGHFEGVASVYSKLVSSPRVISFLNDWWRSLENINRKFDLFL